MKNINRGQFLMGSLAAAMMPLDGFSAASSEPRLFGMLLHLGMNMWSDKPVPRPEGDYTGMELYKPSQKMLEKWGPIFWKAERLMGKAAFLRFDEACWRSVTEKMQKAGMNFVMIDLGEGVVYPSHPELAVKGAWTPDKLKGELKRLRQMGLEPIPKLNFSATHDLWLGEYARMVSTPKYYQVVSDLIGDVCEIFGTPRYFHLGYDEEDYHHQMSDSHVVIRQGDLWWHDLLHAVGEVERRGSRAWIWSDKIWHAKDDFLKRMPRSVLQSNWYYLGDFNPKDEHNPVHGASLYPMVHAYDWLEEGGYDQVPCVSSVGDWRVPDYNNPVLTLEYCRERAHVASARMKGLLMAPWCLTMDFTEPYFDHALELMAPAKKVLDGWPA